MARTQARLLVRIWNDPDFLRLPRRAQGTYMFLLSQANLSHAGLLPLTVKRWAKAAGEYTVEELEEDLARLEDEDYIVIDRETEELLVRTLVRNDGVWKQPKVMLAMKADVGEIMSPRLRYRLREELLKIDVAVLEKEDTRTAIAGVISDVVEALPDTPPQGYAVPVGEPLPYPHAGAGARSSASTTASTTSHIPVAPAKPTRKPDEIWDALLEACHVDPTSVTASSRGAYNRAAADLKAVDATPEEIRRRAAIFRGQWRDVSLTPTALARRWGECDRPFVAASSQTPLSRQLDAAEERARVSMQQRKALP